MQLSLIPTTSTKTANKKQDRINAIPPTASSAILS